MLSGALSPGVKRAGHEADHSPSSSGEVKKCWSHTSTPPIYVYGVLLDCLSIGANLPLTYMHLNLLTLELQSWGLQPPFLQEPHTLYCVSKALRISDVDLVLRQVRIEREVAAKQPRLRAIPRDELAGCGAPDHGEVTLPDMMMALWNRPADKPGTHAIS
jgi:hypothetical protein